MENYSEIEVIEQAIQTEKLGSDFYTNMAKKFEKDEQLRELFETLALKEQQHEKIFSDLRESSGFQLPDEWGEVSKYLSAIVESEFFLAKNKSLPSLEHLKSIKDAVLFAIGFEKETLLYYHSLRDVISEKDIIDEIINEERSHIVWLSEFKRTTSVS
jgi:rubrerythrin